MNNASALEWLKSLDLDDIPIIPTEAMWCGHRSHPDYSNRFPWVVKTLFSDFDFKIYVEIGIAQGGGLVMAHGFSPSGIIVGIDPLEKPPESKTVSHSIFIHDNVHLLRKKSQEAVEDLKEILGESLIDLIVVDGDHTYDGAINDFVSYLPMMRVGGLMWFDDIAHEPGVSKAWEEIKDGLLLGGVEYKCWDWGIGEIEGGKKDSQGRIGIDGSWVARIS